MKWNRSEIDYLSPILEQIAADLGPVEGKKLLVLGSANGEVALRLAEMMEFGHVTGLELDQEALENARRSAHEMGLDDLVEFKPADKQFIPMTEASFDGLVSEFIIYPTSTPSEIGQLEMARVLRPGGKLVLTDVIVTSPLPQDVRQELISLGLDYLCEATVADFRSWMLAAGLTNVEVIDLTPTLRNVWENRRQVDQNSQHRLAYFHLLDDPSTSLDKAIFYIYVRGEKPHNPPSLSTVKNGSQDNTTD
ncbi:MAG TPA: methyltransferase domain-containing protein [Anaerolineales bacterium]